LWTLTHHRDFAKAFVPLLGNDGTIGDSFHITSEELLTWNRIFELVAHAAGAPEPRLVHVPSDVIATYDPNWGASLLGDKTHSLMFDNAKIKRMVPGFSADIAFSRGVREIISWYEEDPARQIVDPSFCRLLDDIIQRQGSQAI
jgi:nucleoside-diphosphate-sugar epimerase